MTEKLEKNNFFKNKIKQCQETRGKEPQNTAFRNKKRCTHYRSHNEISPHKKTWKYSYHIGTAMACMGACSEDTMPATTEILVH